jgi:hypothetical protein
MVRITAKKGKYFFADGILLLSGLSVDVNEGSLALSTLKSIKEAFLTGRLTISTEHISLIDNAIAIKTSSGSGEGGAVSSVNGEVGNVVLDASEIDFSAGLSVEQKINSLATVAFSGNYSDLINKPTGSGGSGEPFTVLEWNPRTYEEYPPYYGVQTKVSYDGTTLQYSNLQSVVMNPYDMGTPNSSNIIIQNGSNGSDTTITITPSGSSVLESGFCINDFKSFQIKPIDLFEYNGTSKGATVMFYLVELEEGETSQTLTPQQLMSKPRKVIITMSNIYQNENRSYTTIGYTLMVNGSVVSNSSTIVSGNFDRLRVEKTESGLLVGGGYWYLDIVSNGFDMTKKFGAVGSISCDSSAFDVYTPFTLKVSEIKGSLEATAYDFTDGLITVNKDEGVVLSFSGSTYTTELRIDSLNEILQYKVYDNAIYPLTNVYIDSNGNLTFKVVNKKELYVRRVSDGSFDYIFQDDGGFSQYNIKPSNNSVKTSYVVDSTLLVNKTLTNGTLPEGVGDGDVLYITENGLFNWNDLKAGDYVTVYDNSSKVMINRLVNTEYDINQKLYSSTGSQGISYNGTSLSIIVDPSSDLSVNNFGQLTIESQTPTYKIETIPVIFNKMYESAAYSNELGSLVLDLESSYNVYVYRLHPSLGVSFSTVNLNTNFYNQTLNISKTVTMLFTNITNQNYVIWPVEFQWANGEAPVLEAGKTLLVTGFLVTSSIQGSLTQNKLLCSYNVF